MQHEGDCGQPRVVVRLSIAVGDKLEGAEALCRVERANDLQVAGHALTKQIVRHVELVEHSHAGARDKAPAARTNLVAIRGVTTDEAQRGHLQRMHAEAVRDEWVRLDVDLTGDALGYECRAAPDSAHVGKGKGEGGGRFE